jgi:AcrR family transcriptional regulator
MKQAPPRKKASKAPNAAAFDERRSALTKQIADALLAKGVADIPLRELALQIGTSDRMLLYYFSDKADLVRSSLDRMSAQLATRLGTRLPNRSSAASVLREVMTLFASKELSRLLTVWADLSARGSRGEEPFRTIARNSIQWWLGWLEERLDMEAGPSRRDMAISILTVIEGARLLEAFVPNLTAGAVPILSGAMVAQRAKSRTQR